VRLVAWNVAHAARERTFHPFFLDAIASLEPDVTHAERVRARLEAVNQT